MSDLVLFKEIATPSGKSIAIATLNAERSLNALSHDMVNLLYPQLQQWQHDDDIAMVLLQGSGEKAFCAGGDIKSLYNNMLTAGQEFSPAVEAYFKDEYQLDYLIHTFDKPFVVWGSGIVMGGGLGMMAAGSHRVVTETSRIAMPEISIGLFPDVGGSYFLNKMPDNCGLFLGITGASINAADAKYTHLADHFISNDNKATFIEKISSINWGNTTTLNHQKLTSLMVELEQQSSTQLPLSNVFKHKDLIKQLTSKVSLAEIVAAIKTTEIEDKWFNRAQQSISRGSALSAELTYQLLQLGKSLSLADCFKMELNAAVKCGQFGEFQEGVRALLIEKDNKPAWKYADIDTVDENIISWFLQSKWSVAEHPLAQLGE